MRAAEVIRATLSSVEPFDADVAVRMAQDFGGRLLAA
jgi:hypothetical protein